MRGALLRSRGLKVTREATPAMTRLLELKALLRRSQALRSLAMVRPLTWTSTGIRRRLRRLP